MPFDGLHFHNVIKRLKEGAVVPFLGAGANRCGREPTQAFAPGLCLPDGGELAALLADEYFYPGDDRRDLARVSQFVSVSLGDGPLYETLRKLFNQDYPVTALHRLLAAVSATFRTREPRPPFLIVTTNYDDVLERAFLEIGEPFDVVFYMADGKQAGRFFHIAPDGGGIRDIPKPNEYDLPLTKRTVILKMHGAVDRSAADSDDNNADSFVITEDHYIDYLTRGTDISSLVPYGVAQKLSRSHFLFLGYGLRDWNLRAILHRLWGQQPLGFNSWAIQRHPDKLESKFWNKRNVEIVDADISEYVAVLQWCLGLGPG